MHTQTSRTGFLGILGLLLVVMAGCSPWSTYPAINTGSSTNPGNEPIPSLMATSLTYANEVFAAGREDFAYNLPAGTPSHVYDLVAAHMGRGHRRASADERSLHVQQVRARLGTAEVDVIYPLESGAYELATVSLQHNIIDGWYVNRARQWHIPMELPEFPEDSLVTAPVETSTETEWVELANVDTDTPETNEQP